MVQRFAWIVRIISTLSCFLLFSSAFSQVAILGSASTGLHASGATITTSHTVSGGGSNTILIVAAACVNDAGTESVTGITYGADALTLLGEYETGNDNQISVWYLKNPTADTRTITATYNATLTEGGTIIALTFQNVDQTTPYDTPVTDCAQNGSVPSNNISSETNDLVLDFVSCESCDGWTAGASQTQYGNLDDDPTFSASSTEAGASTVTMSWSWPQTNEHRCQVVINLNQAAAAGASGQIIRIRSSLE